MRSLMRWPRIDHYSALRYHREEFETGRPVLMYHNIDSCPSGHPGRVLYVSSSLFRRQIRELKEAGFRGATMDDLRAGVGNPAKLVAITFDDGYENVFRNTMAPLAENGFRAIQFLISGLIGRKNEGDSPPGEAPDRRMDASQIRDWLAAGHQVGSHTVTHPYLSKIPLARAREEIFASKKWLEDRFGIPIEHFSYPYGDWNQAVRDLVVEAGYTTACTTQPGVNDQTTSPFELRRFLACHPIRTPKQILIRFASRLRGTSRPESGRPILGPTRGSGRNWQPTANGSGRAAVNTDHDETGLVRRGDNIIST